MKIYGSCLFEHSKFLKCNIFVSYKKYQLHEQPLNVQLPVKIGHHESINLIKVF